MIAIIDGVDGVGKTTICREMEKYGIVYFSADLYKSIAKVPIEMRIWPDIPLMAMARKVDTHIIFDRSLISVLVYNYGSDIYHRLLNFSDWYFKDVKVIFNDFWHTETLLKRFPNFEAAKFFEENNRFKSVYEKLGLKYKTIYAEDNIEYKVKEILRYVCII